MKPVDQRSPPRQSAPATAKPNFPPSVAQRTHLSPAAPTQNPSRPALHPAKTQNENCCPMHLLVDSTGLKLYGAGEWRVEKHGAKRRRSWRKLHLGVDA